LFNKPAPDFEIKMTKVSHGANIWKNQSLVHSTIQIFTGGGCKAAVTPLIVQENMHTTKND